MRSSTLTTALAAVAALGLSSAVLAQQVTEMHAGKGGSPHVRAAWPVDGAHITIEYGRPLVKGRKIFGGLEPYGKVWRAGADEATTLSTDKALKIGDLTLAPGKYTLWVWLDAKEWQLIVNKQTGQWGTQYNKGEDLGRTAMKTETLPKTVEQLTFSIDDTAAGGTLSLAWEQTRASVAFTVQ